MSPRPRKQRWIAERTLQCGESSRNVIRVRIGEPYQVSGIEWHCAYEIRGAGLNVKHRVCGGDAMQSLDLTFVVIRNLLDSLDVEVSWNGSPVQLAFPKRIPYIGTIKFTKKLEKQVDRELRLHVSELKKKALRRSSRSARAKKV